MIYFIVKIHLDRAQIEGWSHRALLICCLTHFLTHLPHATRGCDHLRRARGEAGAHGRTCCWLRKGTRRVFMLVLKNYQKGLKSQLHSLWPDATFCSVIIHLTQILVTPRIHSKVCFKTKIIGCFCFSSCFQQQKP